MLPTILTALALAAVAPAPYHSADPVAKPSQSRIVVRDLIWYCGDGGCAAGKSDSRPAIVCARARQGAGAASRL